MDEDIRKAQVLVEALGWIRQFRGRYVVIKLGGSALEQSESVHTFLTDIVIMEAVGMRPILVHGGGKAINRAMDQAGIKARFVQGRRYTDEKTIEIVARVLARDICGDLVSQIRQQGGLARGLSYLSENCLRAERLMLEDDGEPIDLGLVGHVVGIDRALLEQTCKAGTVPVIPSIGLDADGRLLNINADTAAADVARLLRAEKLVFVSDVPGILLDRNDQSTLMSHIEVRRCRQLISDGVIDSGMVPKVEAALVALQAGVHKVHIVDGRMPHSILLEIHSDKGIGTEIVP